VTDERERALDRAVRALARGDHSTAGLRAKLERAGISDSAQVDAVEKLARAGYLDDARFARERATSGYAATWRRRASQREPSRRRSRRSSPNGSGHSPWLQASAEAFERPAPSPAVASPRTSSRSC
jgi:RecX family protein